MENEHVNPAGVPAEGQPAVPAVEETAPAAPAAPEVGSPEYNAQMAAYGNAAQGNVPAKFVREDGSVDVDSLAKSYMELERSASGAEPAAEPVAEPTSEEAIAAVAADAVEDSMNTLQIPETPEEEASVEGGEEPRMTEADWQGFKDTIWKSGELTEADAALLAEKSGWDATTVKQWGLAQRAEVKASFDQAADVVGGHDTLSSMLKWASENLPAEEQKAINSQLRQPGATEYVLLGVKSRYEASIAPEARASQEPAATPRRAVTAPVVSKAPTGFASHAEFQAARSNPSFVSDPTYRSQVMQRMSETDWSTLPRV